MPSVMEDTILKATKVNKFKYPAHRQDLLAACVRGIDKLSDPAFNKLDDAILDWHEDAVRKMDTKKNLPEFPDFKPDEEEEAGEVQPEEVTATDEPVEEPVTEEENEAAEAAGSAAKEKKQVAARPPPKKLRERDPEQPGGYRTTRYDNLTGEKDKFGFVAGTKVSDAVKMYEKGATVNQVEEALHGRFFNCMKQVEKRGHLVERFPGNIWRVTHKDEVAKPAKAKKSTKQEPEIQPEADE